MFRPFPRRPRAQLLLVLLGGLVTGCKSSGAPTDPALAGSNSMQPTMTAPTDDSAVQEHLVQHLKATRVVEGLREVDLDLENRGEDTVRFSYQVEWLDRAGAPVMDQDARWTPLVLEPGQRTPLALRAPHPVAESWRLVAVAQESSEPVDASSKRAPSN